MPIVQGAAEGPKREQIRRQAIVLVHGMGEQIPMETVRDFATAVWASDRDLHSSDEKKAGQLFSVPDSTTGSRELRRISTRKSRRRHSDVNDDNDEYAVRNEFFELYWADSTTDTTWADFLGWYVRLVVRWPSEAPKAVRWIWGLLWVVNVAFLLSAQIALLWFVTTEIDQLFIDAIEKARGAQQSLDWGATYRLAFQTPTVVSTWDLVWAPGLVALIGALVYKFSRFKKPSYWLAVTAGFIALWSLVVLIGVLAKPFVFQTSREHNIFWPGFIALVGAALLLIQGLLIKFFGDVARYTVASPGNIVPRQKVRDRGVELINKLTASGQYDRIILVAHSLGCLIAYDILCLLWADYVAIRRKPELVPNADAVRGEVEEVIEAATRKPIDLRRFRRAQRALFRALRKADDERLDAAGPDEEKVSARWLISDLVTIANPLTHAEFLLAPKKKQLGDRFRWRELSRCPPRFEEFRGRKSFVYQPTQGGALRFNHDAVFSVVRWTSIHDRPEDPRLFLTGDFISGPVSGIFGQGVVDVRVQPRRKSGSLPQRLFTHTIYWELKQADYGHAPRSVSVIRNALNILDESKREDALLKDANRAVGEAGG
ncbi:MAG: hypothetical protein KDJ40_08330 [Hyphomicrobiales bacterium]|nr:hypothetical protein [Hyphomicrobiales bacterium]